MYRSPVLRLFDQKSKGSKPRPQVARKSPQVSGLV